VLRIRSFSRSNLLFLVEKCSLSFILIFKASWGLYAYKVMYLYRYAPGVLFIVRYGLVVRVFAGEHMAEDATKIDESHIYALVIDYAKGWIT
jgi:hypothetical protein